MTKQNIYYFSGVLTIFACVGCETIFDYSEVLSCKFCCEKCQRQILTFVADESENFETTEENRSNCKEK